MSIAAAATAWLAQAPPTGPQGPEFGGSSPIGLVVTLLMLIAVVLLVRSMNKHLRKVPKSFDPPEESEPEQNGAERNNPAQNGPANPTQN